MSRPRKLAPIRADGDLAARLLEKADDPDSLANVAFSGLSQQTLIAYKFEIQRLANWMDVPTPTEALRILTQCGRGQARRICTAYLNQLRDSGLKSNTIARACAAINSMIKRLSYAEMCPYELGLRYKGELPYKDTSGPSDIDWKRLCDEISSHGTHDSKRDLAIVLLMSTMGLRRNEISQINWPEDVDFKKKSVMVMGKGRRGARETVALSTSAEAAVKSWLQVRGASHGPLFVRLHNPKTLERMDGDAIYYRIAKVWSKRSGVKIHPHALRHLAITTAAKHWHGPSGGLTEFARHRNPAVTKLYIHNMEDVARDVVKTVDQATQKILKSSPTAPSDRT